jgi:hypothetical protein
VFAFCFDCLVAVTEILLNALIPTYLSRNGTRLSTRYLLLELLVVLPNFSLLFGYHPDMDSEKPGVGSFGYFLSFSRDMFLLLSGFDIQPNLDESLHHMGCQQLDWIVAIYCGMCWSFTPSVSNSVSLSLELRDLAIFSSRNETLKQRSGKEVYRRLFSLVKLTTLVAVNLSIIGATKSFNGVHAGPKIHCPWLGRLYS